MSGGGNQYTLAALATTASHSVPRSGATRCSIGTPTDGTGSRSDASRRDRLAKETMTAFVAADYGPKEDFRVRKLDLPD